MLFVRAVLVTLQGTKTFKKIQTKQFREVLLKKKRII